MDSQVRLMKAEIIPPESFVAVDHRLFIDTNVFMDTDPVRSAGLKKLFERCQDAAIRNENGIVVPSKVIDELIWQSGLDTSLLRLNVLASGSRCWSNSRLIELYATISGIARTLMLTTFLSICSPATLGATTCASSQMTSRYCCGFDFLP